MKNSNEGFRQFGEKITLLGAEENPLFEKLRQKQISASGIHEQKIKNARQELYDLTSPTLANWERGTLDPSKDRESIDRLCKRLRESVDVELRFEHFTDAYSKYDFGKLIGLDRDQTRLILDTRLYAKPIRPRGYILQEPIAGRLLEQYEGIYHLYYYGTRRSSSSGPRLVLAALRVRHVVNTPNNLAVVACKLHIPRSANRPKADFYPYEGLLTQQPQHRHVYWSFAEQSLESKPQHDMVSIMAECLRGNGTEIMRGMLSSADADHRMYATMVYMEKQPATSAQLADRDFIKKLMREDIWTTDSKDEVDRMLAAKPVLSRMLREPYVPF